MPARHRNPPRLPWPALIDLKPAANAQHSQHRKDCAAASNGPATMHTPMRTPTPSALHHASRHSVSHITSCPLLLHITSQGTKFAKALESISIFRRAVLLRYDGDVISKSSTWASGESVEE